MLNREPRVRHDLQPNSRTVRRARVAPVGWQFAQLRRRVLPHSLVQGYVERNTRGAKQAVYHLINAVVHDRWPFVGQYVAVDLLQLHMIIPHELDNSNTKNGACVSAAGSESWQLPRARLALTETCRTAAGEQISVDGGWTAPSLA